MKKTIKIPLIAVIGVVLLITVLSIIVNNSIFNGKDRKFRKNAKIVFDNISNVLENETIENNMTRKQQNKYTNNGTVDYIGKDNYTFRLAELSGKTDVVNKAFEQTVDFHYSDDVKLQASIVKNNDFYGFFAPEILGQYLIFENKNLKQFAEKLGMDSSSVPDSISIDDYTNSKIDLEEIKKISEKYIDIIKKNVKKEDYSITKKDNQKMYTLTISEAKVKIIFEEMLNQLKEDEYITEQYMQGMSKEDFGRYIDSYIEDMKNMELGDYEISTGKKSNNITFLIIKTKSMEIDIETVEKKINVTLYSIEDQEKKEAGNLLVAQEASNNSVKYTVTYNYKLNSLYSNLQTDTMVENTDQNIAQGTNTNPSYTISLHIEEANVSENSIKDNVSFMIEANSSENNNRMGITFQNTLQFDNSIEVTRFTENNSVVANDLSKDSLNNVFERLMKKISEVNKKKLEKTKNDEESILKVINQIS